MSERRAVWAEMRLGPFLFGLLFIALGVSGLTDTDLSTAWVSAALLAMAGIVGLMKTANPGGDK